MLGIVGGASASNIAYLFPNSLVFVHPFDDGGDSGRLSKEVGVLPVGDARRVYSMVSGLNILEERDMITNHKIGNILLSNYVSKYGPNHGLLKFASDFNIPTKALYTTVERANICFVSNKLYCGEHFLDETGFEINSIWLDSKVRINNLSKGFIDNIDYLLFSYGSLYGSLIPHLLVDGFLDTIEDKIKILIVNGKKDNQMKGINTVSEYVSILENYGFHPDYVLIPKDGDLENDYTNAIVVDSTNGIYNPKAVKSTIESILQQS